MTELSEAINLVEFTNDMLADEYAAEDHDDPEQLELINATMLVLKAVRTLPTVSRDYAAIRYQPGYYWTRGVIPFREPTRWWMVRVYKPMWTEESGKDHCQWFYQDGSGGYEIESGEWVLIPEPLG